MDGNQIQKSKPDPEVFLLAAQRLDVLPINCCVIEDAEAGIQAALAGGMSVLGVGYAAQSQQATLRAADLATISVADFIAWCQKL